MGYINNFLIKFVNQALSDLLDYTVRDFIKVSLYSEDNDFFV